MVIIPTKFARHLQQFMDDNVLLIFKYTLRKIKSGIKSNADSIDLFMLEDGSIKAFIKRKDYIKVLESAIEQFIIHEEYELAREADLILRERWAEQLIQESSHKAVIDSSSYTEPTEEG